MILGIGVDLIDAHRLEEALREHKERFVNRLFLASEQEFVEKRVTAYSGKHTPLLIRAVEYSKIYAAKEAFVKALGTGFRDGLSWQHIEVRRFPSGQPSLNLLSLAQQKLRDLAGTGDINLHLSLSDEIPLVQAFVIIEKVPPYKES